VESLGGTYHHVVGMDVAGALLDFARGVNATQLVLGASRRGRLAQVFAAGIGVTTTARSGAIDVHLVTHEQIGRGRRRPLISGQAALSRPRRIAGFALAVAGLPLLTVVLSALRGDLALASDILFYLGWVILVALVGGMWPAVLTALAGSQLLNYYFTPPLHRFSIAETEDLLSLVIFLVIAVAVSAVVDTAARRTREAARASADASTLATVAGSVLRGDRPLPALLERLRETFGLESVTLLERRAGAPPSPDRPHDPASWRIAATVGGEPCAAPGEGATDVPVDDDLALVLRGHPLPAADRRIVEAFAAQAALALRQERLAREAATARPLAEADKMRTALLAAVSHDLRTPLASAKAAVASLRGHDVDFSDDDRDELLATADESLDKLARLVANLLDMSRLQAGAIGLSLAEIGLEDAVPRALDELGPLARAVRVRIPPELPAVHADPALLERVLVNLIANALRFSPPGRPPDVTARDEDGAVQLRVVDHGPGIPEDARDTMFQPFQRLGDRDNHNGVGLGLALSRGLAEAMGGTLLPDTTPGGGLTMLLTLPSVEAREVTAPGEASAAEAADRAIVQRLRRRPSTGRDTTR
jgi:two-component system sensor histidine kinase KdpD